MCVLSSPGTRFTSPAFRGAAAAPLGWDAGGHALSDSVLQEGVKRKKPKAAWLGYLLSAIPAWCGRSPPNPLRSLSLQATCALYEIMSAPESGAAVLGLYPPLFVTLLLRLSCTVGVQLPKSLQSRERRSSSLGSAARSLHPARYGAGHRGRSAARAAPRWCQHRGCAGVTPAVVTVAPSG